MRKYIVDNLENQTIEGNITINGDLAITGTTSINISNSNFDTISTTAINVSGDLTVYGDLINVIDDSYRIATYRALLTQTGTVSGTSLSNFNSGLIIGETYTITNYVSGDDFSNIANIQSGTISETGCQFIATGEEPLVWNNNSELTSYGNLVVSVLENNLGYDIAWEHAPFGGEGYYWAFNDTTGPTPYSFPRENVTIAVQKKYTFDGGPNNNHFTTFNASILGKDDVIGFDVFDGSAERANQLYYTPVEIKHKQTAVKTLLIYSQLFGSTDTQNSNITDIYAAALVITGSGSYYGDPGFIGIDSINSTINDYWTENNLENGSTYIFNVIWGPGSTASSLAYVWYYYNSPSNDRIFITPVDPTDESWKNENNTDGTALTGTFNWPARISLYSPVIKKQNDWYC